MGTRSSKADYNVTVFENPPEPLSSVPEDTFISLYDFPSFGSTELGMSIGERLTIISDNGDVLMVRSITTSREMYIPAKYVAKVTHRWLFTGISRRKAEELLMQPENRIGSFLIRESETHTGCLSLSVRCRVSVLYSNCIKHYLIHRLQNGRIYVSPTCSFASLKQLVEHYSESADKLCCRLDRPCFIQGLAVPREDVPAANRKPRNISRSMFLRRRTGSSVLMVSEGLRESISSYLQMTEGNDHGWDT